MLASVPRAELNPKGEEEFLAASADFSKVILSNEDRTLLGSSTGTKSGSDLYEYSEGQLRLLNVLSDGATIGSCGASIAHGHEGYNESGYQLSSPHAVSENGSRVFFEAVPGSNCAAQRDLYARVEGSETEDIGAYTFVAANAEGTQLLLEQRTGSAREILLYDVASKTTEPLFTTHEEVSPMVVSEDLTAIYFGSEEGLTPEAPPISNSSQSEDLGAETPFNLYRYDIAAKKLSFVAQSAGGQGLNFDEHSVSPDGRYYYWGSEGVAGVPGGEGSQVYRYDSVEGVVQCMSCASPSDPRPKLSALFLEGAPGVDGVPVATTSSANGDFVFFDTPAALVPQDIDGESNPEGGGTGGLSSFFYSPSSDVYEWRKNGVDGCAHRQGCLRLITTGEGGHMNVLLGTTPSGEDVFFATHEPLVAQDIDTAGDIYDARVDGGFPSPPPRPVECEANTCSTPLSAPVDTTPASLTFAGDGNVVQQPAAKPVVKAKKPKAKKKKRRERAGKRVVRRGNARKSPRGKK